MFIDFRERGREGEWEGEKHPSVVSCTHPSWDQTHNSGIKVNRQSNLWPFGLRDDAPSHWATPARAEVQFSYCKLDNLALKSECWIWIDRCFIFFSFALSWDEHIISVALGGLGRGWLICDTFTPTPSPVFRATSLFPTAFQVTVGLPFTSKLSCAPDLIFVSLGDRGNRLSSGKRWQGIIRPKPSILQMRKTEAQRSEFLNSQRWIIGLQWIAPFCVQLCCFLGGNMNGAHKLPHFLGWRPLVVLKMI